MKNGSEGTTVQRPRLEMSPVEGKLTGPRPLALGSLSPEAALSGLAALSPPPTTSL